MVRVRIFCHADIQALRNRSDQLLSVELVSLDSVSIASDSCKLLLNLIEGRDYPKKVKLTERRYWSCSQMVLLSLIAGVALELHKIKHDLYPLLSREAKLGDDGFVEHLLLLKNSALALLNLGETHVLARLRDEDLNSGQVRMLGVMLKDSADRVLEEGFTILWLREHRVTWLVQHVTALLATPVRFSDSEI
jgi:hypothetical protein